jgi:hypothetical protein
MFKIDQKVFDYSYGWGKVKIIYKEDRLTVHFPKDLRVDYSKNGCRFLSAVKGDVSEYPTLATKEYTLCGFTQESQIDWEYYIGKWCIFKDIDSDPIYIDRLESVDERGYFYNEREGNFWLTCKPLTEEQIKILNLH